MITNFKIFENKTDKFWIIRNDEFLNVRLYKIGMSISEIIRINPKDETSARHIITYFNNPNRKNKKYAFYKNDNLTENNWDFYSYNSPSDIFKIVEFNDDIIDVKITKEDILNYKIAETAEKYNL